MKEQIPHTEDAAADGQVSDAPATFTSGGIGHGLKTTIPLEVGGIVYGVIFVVVAANVGWTGGEAVIMSILVNSGAAQVAATDVWAVPPPMLTIWLTTTLVSMRYLVLGASLRPWLSQVSPGSGIWLTLHADGSELGSGVSGVPLRTTRRRVPAGEWPGVSRIVGHRNCCRDNDWQCPARPRGMEPGFHAHRHLRGTGGGPLDW